MKHRCSVLSFFSALVIPAFGLWCVCSSFQKPMSVSEEELEKGHLAPDPERMLLLGEGEDSKSWAHE